MSKRDDYRQTLRGLDDWEPYLLAESGLPGPRGNIELAQAVAERGDEALDHGPEPGQAAPGSLRRQLGDGLFIAPGCSG